MLITLQTETESPAKSGPSALSQEMLRGESVKYFEDLLEIWAFLL
jgi:hypothetical protein